MTHGTLGDNLLTPGRMLLMAIKTRDGSLMFAAVAGYCCRFILVALNAVGNIKGNQLCLCLRGKYSQHGSYHESRG